MSGIDSVYKDVYENATVAVLNSLLFASRADLNRFRRVIVVWVFHCLKKRQGRTLISRVHATRRE